MAAKLTVRRLAGTVLLLVLVAATAAAEPPDGSDAAPGFWETVLHPHALKVQKLLADGSRQREMANQYSESQQLAERTRLLGEALERFQKAVALDPHNLQAVKEVALTAYDLGDYAHALDALLELGRLDPDDRRLVPKLCVSYIKLRRFDDAIAVLERILGGELTPPERATMLGLLGYAYMAQGRLEDAIDAYDRAARAQPYGTDVLALNGLAVAYDRDEQLGRAAEVLEQVRQLDPSFSHLLVLGGAPASNGPQIPFAPPSDKHYWLALAYEAQKLWAEAGVEWHAYLAAGDAVYRRRADEHLRSVTQELTRHRPAGPAHPAPARRPR
jgi:tetratricopeptide (TPR) repeat protein